MLGEAAPQANAERRPQKFMGTKWPAWDADWEAANRIRDMDEEGVDVQVLVPSVPWGHDNPAVEIEFMRANHRFLDDFCSAYPARLKALLIINAKFIKESVDENKTWGRSAWAVGAWVNLPLDFPLDHPDLHPIWAAIEQEGLCVVHHSFSGGYPGYRDTWSNPFIGRTASHPWGAMRAMAAFFGAGLMDRYADLRFAILESGFGWLPFWAMRMQDQVDYMGYVPELRHTMMEYMSGGRFFASIVLHEDARRAHVDLRRAPADPAVELDGVHAKEVRGRRIAQQQRVGAARDFEEESGGIPGERHVLGVDAGKSRHIDIEIPGSGVHERVRAEAGGEEIGVRPGAALQQVVARAAFEDVVARAAGKLVVALAAAQHVVAGIANERVIVIATFERVVALPAIEKVVTRFAVQGIGARFAMNPIF
jgi:predicted TIM-barrel fold metal-dependent hydrolase